MDRPGRKCVSPRLAVDLGRRGLAGGSHARVPSMDERISVQEPGIHAIGDVLLRRRIPVQRRRRVHRQNATFARALHPRLAGINTNKRTCVGLKKKRQSTRELFILLTHGPVQRAYRDIRSISFSSRVMQCNLPFLRTNPVFFSTNTPMSNVHYMRWIRQPGSSLIRTCDRRANGKILEDWWRAPHSFTDRLSTIVRVEIEHADRRTGGVGYGRCFDVDVYMGYCTDAYSHYLCDVLTADSYRISARVSF